MKSLQEVPKWKSKGDLLDFSLQQNRAGGDNMRLYSAVYTEAANSLLYLYYRERCFKSMIISCSWFILFGFPTMWLFYKTRHVSILQTDRGSSFISKLHSRGRIHKTHKLSQPVNSSCHHHHHPPNLAVCLNFPSLPLPVSDSATLHPTSPPVFSASPPPQKGSNIFAHHFPDISM